MEFKRLDDYPRYRIYTNGDVYSEWSKTDKLLKHRLNAYGYYYVMLSNGDKQKHFLIHRLLAILFIPNQDFKKEVDHINRVKTDNRLENLRWLDRSRQNLNKELKDNSSGYPFINKSKDKKRKSGFCFRCQIRRNNKYVLATGRVTLEDAIELVRTFLLENEWVFDGYPEETTIKIKEKYKI